MKHTYVVPTVEVVSLMCEDVLTLSLNTNSVSFGEDDIMIIF